MNDGVKVIKLIRYYPLHVRGGKAEVGDVLRVPELLSLWLVDQGYAANA